MVKGRMNEKVYTHRCQVGGRENTGALMSRLVAQDFNNGKAEVELFSLVVGQRAGITRRWTSGW